MGNIQSFEDDEPIEDSVIELLEKINNKKLIFTEISSSPIPSALLISTHYKELNTKIKCLGKETEEYDYISKYLENTHGPTHKFKLKIQNIFNVYRKSDYWNYKPNKKFGNLKLLWHGTKMSNIKSILKNGLLTEPPSNTTKTGSMFGKGIYFADVVTKAAQYCGANIFNPHGILILAEVALGKHYYKTESENVTKLPDGKNSVKALGRYKPNKLQTIRTKFGAQIPLGTLDLQNDLTTKLDYSEYIVYDVHQVFIQYLVLVDFEYLDGNCTIQ